MAVVSFYNLPAVNDLLLNSFPGAAAAYSLRKLRTAYTGSAIRVRRSSDNTEQDIGFTTSGNLNQGALATFCSGTNGFVTTWYDQAGSNNATQSTAANQPKIYDSSTGVLQENSRPTIDFTSSHFLVCASANTSQSGWVFWVAKSGATLSSSITQSNTAVNTEYISLQNSSPLLAQNNSARFIFDNSNIAYGDDATFGLQALTTHSSDGSSWSLNINGVQQTMNVFVGSNTGAWFGDRQYPMYINRINRLSAFNFEGKYQEIIIYNTNQSPNRTAIETNINNYYNIYP